MANRPRLKTPFDEPKQAAGEEQPPPRKRFRFGTRSLFGMTFIVAVAAAGAGGIMRQGDDYRYYIVFALLAPFLALTAASLFHSFTKPRKKRR